MLDLDLAEMTWEDVRDLDTARTVAILPVGATEAHGPHLPLATDVVIADAMARDGAARMRDHGLMPVVLPSMPYTTAGFAAAFAGTITVRAQLIAEIIFDVATSLARAGFGTLVLANAHLDPAHVGCLRGATSRIREEDVLDVVFPDVTRKPWALRLTDEFKSGACHAGQYETSIVMAATPALVRDEARRGLADNPVSLSDAIRDGKTSFAAAGGADAYFGYPARATAEEGSATIAALGGILCDAVLEARAAATANTTDGGPPDHGTKASEAPES